MKNIFNIRRFIYIFGLTSATWLLLPQLLSSFFVNANIDIGKHVLQVFGFEICSVIKKYYQHGFANVSFEFSKLTFIPMFIIYYIVFFINDYRLKK